MSCTIHGCRNLETKCADCGRLVSTAKIDDGWISVKDEDPPNDKCFIAADEYGVEKAYWSGKSYVGYCPCNCCTGCTTIKFDYWMPLPKPPQDKDDITT